MRSQHKAFPLTHDIPLVAPTYRLFMRVNNDGADRFWGGKSLVVQGQKLKIWTSRKEPRPGHKVLNIKGDGWTFSFTTYFAPSYDLEAVAQFSAGAVVVAESAYNVLVYDMAVTDKEALRKQLTLLKMFEEIDERPLKIRTRGSHDDDGEDF